MQNSFIEHVNITVSDPKETADLMRKLFDWKVRWQGPAKDDGFTVHVGTDSHYLAIYSTGNSKNGEDISYRTKGGLNHVGIVVDDLDLIEQRVTQAGLQPYNHGDYEPGRRFYFNDENGIEFEVVSYGEHQ